MSEEAIEIREFRQDDLEAVVEFSLRAWEPVFASVRGVLGDDIFLRLHPDWKRTRKTLSDQVVRMTRVTFSWQLPADAPSVSSPSL